MIQTKGKNRFKLWLQWIVANALGELVGLGTVSLVALFVYAQFDESVSNVATVLFALLMILLGAFEGLAIALAQWLVLRQIIRRIALRVWIVATLIGAIIAWFLGMLPGAIAHLTNSATETPPPVMNEAQVIFLTSVMGVILGLILAFPQWLVLRNYL